MDYTLIKTYKIWSAFLCCFIAKNIGLDNKTIQSYLNILKETGLVELISKNKSESNILRQTEKMYLDNPDLYK